MFYWPRNSIANLQFSTVWYACLIKLLFIHKGRYNTPSINVMKYQIQNLYWLKFNTKKMEVVLDRYNRNYLYWNSPNYLSQFPHSLMIQMVMVNKDSNILYPTYFSKLQCKLYYVNIFRHICTLFNYSIFINTSRFKQCCLILRNISQYFLWNP